MYVVCAQGQKLVYNGDVSIACRMVEDRSKEGRDIALREPAQKSQGKVVVGL